MTTALPVALVAGILAVAIATALGIAKQRRERSRVRASLFRESRIAPAAPIDPSCLADVPEPVARYLRHVLPDGYTRPRAVEFTQTGTLRTGAHSGRWLPFTAREVVSLARPGFFWDARVQLPLGLHLEIRDAYNQGAGYGAVALLSALTLAADSAGTELTAGALHRYLAEAVWYPVALFPSACLTWTPISSTKAQATLTDGPVVVSLQFWFNQAGEVTGIYTPCRWGRFDGHYEQRPWEGHFARYEDREGILVPTAGEVGWYEAGELALVWRGTILSLESR